MTDDTVTVAALKEALALGSSSEGWIEQILDSIRQIESLEEGQRLVRADQITVDDVGLFIFRRPRLEENEGRGPVSGRLMGVLQSGRATYLSVNGLILEINAWDTFLLSKEPLD